MEGIFYFPTLPSLLLFLRHAAIFFALSEEYWVFIYYSTSFLLVCFMWRLYFFQIDETFSHETDMISEKTTHTHIYTRVVQKVSRLFSYGHFYWLYTYETLVPFEVISSGCNALVVPFQQLLEGPMEVLLCERVNDLRHSLFHLLNCLITTASKFFLELRE